MILPKDFFDKRPLSWSALSSFEYDPEQWYKTYALGIRQSSKEMTFGSLIDKRFQDDPAFFPEIPRGELLQHKMKMTFAGIPLIGVPDVLAIEIEKILGDLKTGKKKWDQKRADETGQLTFYLFLIFLKYKIRPEDFKLFIAWLPTQDNGDFTITLIKNCKPVIFKTKRTMADLLKMGERIKATTKAMREYAKNHE